MSQRVLLTHLPLTTGRDGSLNRIADVTPHNLNQTDTHSYTADGHVPSTLDQRTRRGSRLSAGEICCGVDIDTACWHVQSVLQRVVRRQDSGPCRALVPQHVFFFCELASVWVRPQRNLHLNRTQNTQHTQQEFSLFVHVRSMSWNVSATSRDQQWTQVRERRHHLRSKQTSVRGNSEWICKKLRSGSLLDLPRVPKVLRRERRLRGARRRTRPSDVEWTTMDSSCRNGN